METVDLVLTGHPEEAEGLPWFLVFRASEGLYLNDVNLLSCIVPDLKLLGVTLHILCDADRCHLMAQKQKQDRHQCAWWSRTSYLVMMEAEETFGVGQGLRMEGVPTPTSMGRSWSPITLRVRLRLVWGLSSFPQIAG